MNNKTKSLIFDFIQFGSLILFLFTGPVIAPNTISVLVQAVAVLVLLEAAWEMRRTKYYRAPDVGRQSELVKTGIYTYVRNPMYLSQLLFVGVLIVSDFSFFRLILYVLYLVNFLFKIQYEESLLKKNFTDFKNYKKSSKRLFPYIY